MSVTLYSLGAVEEVTGSKHILEVDGRSYLIDCGAFQGKRAVADKKNRDLKIPPEKIVCESRFVCDKTAGGCPCLLPAKQNALLPDTYNTYSNRAKKA